MATVVHLGAQPKDEVITFEKAFGEFSSAEDSSNAAGHRRRKAKRMQGRAERQAARQARRAARLAAKLARRQARADARAARKATKDGSADSSANPSANPCTPTPDGNGGFTDGNGNPVDANCNPVAASAPTAGGTNPNNGQNPNAAAASQGQSGGGDSGGGGSDDGSGDDGSQDGGGGDDGGGSSDPDVGDDSGSGGGQGSGNGGGGHKRHKKQQQSDDSGSDDSDDSQDSGDSGDDSKQEDTNDDTTTDKSNDGESYDSDGDDVGDASDYFDGGVGAEDYFNEFADGSKKSKINPAVADLAKKIEWNKELVSRLRVLKAKQIGEYKDTTETQHKITDSLNRISQLQNDLDKYSKFEGKFSSDGSFSCASGTTAPTEQMVKSRANEIKGAKRLAYNERLNLHKGIKSSKHLEEAKNHAIRKGHAGSETPVDAELNPEFATQTIKVPPQDKRSNAEGTGLNGLDLRQDYDAPFTRIVELESDFTGAEVKDKLKANWKGLAIGAAIGIGVIVVVKLIGKNKAAKTV